MKFISNIFKIIAGKFDKDPIDIGSKELILNFNSKYLEQINITVKSLFGQIPPDWSTILSLLANDPAKLLEEKLFAEYELSDLVDETNEYLVFDILYDFLLEKQAMLQIDWRGEAENYEFAKFVVNRCESLVNKNEVMSLKEKLINISNIAYDIEYDEDNSIVEYLFNHFNQELANFKLNIMYLDRGWDMHQFVVVKNKDISELLKVDIQGSYIFGFKDRF